MKTSEAQKQLEEVLIKKYCRGIYSSLQVFIVLEDRCEPSQPWPSQWGAQEQPIFKQYRIWMAPLEDTLHKYQHATFLNGFCNQKKMCASVCTNILQISFLKLCSKRALTLTSSNVSQSSQDVEGGFAATHGLWTRTNQLQDRYWQRKFLLAAQLFRFQTFC